MILTKQIQTGGPVLLQTALMITCLEAVMIALETSIEIVTIQTDILMGIGSYCNGLHLDMDRYGGRDRYDDRGGRDYDRGHYKTQIILRASFFPPV